MEYHPRHVELGRSTAQGLVTAFYPVVRVAELRCDQLEDYAGHTGGSG